MHKSQFQKIDPYDWFCGPGSRLEYGITLWRIFSTGVVTTLQPGLKSNSTKRVQKCDRGALWSAQQAVADIGQVQVCCVSLNLSLYPRPCQHTACQDNATVLERTYPGLLSRPRKLTRANNEPHQDSHLNRSRENNTYWPVYWPSYGDG